jgi:hypothetical protein
MYAIEFMADIFNIKKNKLGVLPMNKNSKKSLSLVSRQFGLTETIKTLANIAILF